jgi:2-keto-4-pentenoate hydratase/2-oxohepta-3-ene-1,7-dioic acid hydratase in catechol pathway
MPGDVIATGTGGGVGNPKGKFLNPGSTCRIEIEGLGEINNPVEAGD